MATDKTYQSSLPPFGGRSPDEERKRRRGTMIALAILIMGLSIFLSVDWRTGRIDALYILLGFLVATIMLLSALYGGKKIEVITPSISLRIGYSFPCPSCGKLVLLDFNLCPYCGCKLKKQVASDRMV